MHEYSAHLFKQRPLTLSLLGLIFLLGLFLRVTAVSSSTVDEPVRGDAKSYFFYGANLQSDGIYSRALPRLFGGPEPKADASIPPGYPLFVAALMTNEWRAGTKESVFRCITPAIRAQAWLSSFVILLVFFIARRVATPRAALIAAFLTAISPHLVNINIYLLTEPLFTLTFWAAMLFVMQDLGSYKGKHLALLGGIGLALAALVRPTVQYLPLLLAAAGVLATGDSWRRWTIFLAAFAVPMVAWGIRNLVSVGIFSDPMAMTATIQVGAYPDFMYNGIPESRGIAYNFDPVLTDYSSLAKTLSVIGERFMAAPGTYLHWYLIGKPISFFQWKIIPIGDYAAQSLLLAGDIYVYPTPHTPYANNSLFIATYLLSRLLYLPCLLTALAAAALAWVPALRPFWGQALPAIRTLSLTLLYVVGIHMIGAPFPRYAIPFQPLLYLLAAGLLAALWRAWRRADRTIEDGAEVL